MEAGRKGILASMLGMKALLVQPVESGNNLQVLEEYLGQVKQLWLTLFNGVKVGVGFNLVTLVFNSDIISYISLGLANKRLQE